MVGLDLVEISRIQAVTEKYGIRFLQRVYTSQELEYCFKESKRIYPELSARFAAKEAVVKSLGTGMRGVTWKDVEVVRNALGKPGIVLHERAKGIADQLGIKQIHISLSHTESVAAAVALIEYNLYNIAEDGELESIEDDTETDETALHIRGLQ